MNAYVYPSRQEKVISGTGAFGMHLLFIALLVFGVNWQKKVEPQANIVDLWTNLPSAAEPKVEPVPERPQPVVPPKVEPAPPKAVAKPEVAKPDIALKEKAEKERRMLEQKQADAKKREEEAKAVQKQQQAKEAADAQRLVKEQEDAQRKIAEQAAAAQNKLIEDYRARIQARIYQAMQPFDDLPKDTFAEVEIIVLPDGNVLAAVIKKNSASAKFNAAVERAVLRSQPLPVPKDAALFSSHFRKIDLTFRPKQ